MTTFLECGAKVSADQRNTATRFYSLINYEATLNQSLCDNEHPNLALKW